MACKSMADIQRKLMKAVKSAMNTTQNKVKKTADKEVSRYYAEYAPKYYVRTGVMEAQAIDDPQNDSGSNWASFTVKVSDGYLEYKYKTGTWLGENVLDAASKGLHGGYNPGYKFNHFWEGGIEDLGDEEGIIDIFRRNLSKYVPVR